MHLHGPADSPTAAQLDCLRVGILSGNARRPGPVCCRGPPEVQGAEARQVRPVQAGAHIDHGCERVIIVLDIMDAIMDAMMCRRS